MSNFKIRGNDNGSGTTTLVSANTTSSTTFYFPGTDGASGTILVTDGTGNLSFSSNITGNITLGTNANNIANIQSSLKIAHNAREDVTVSATAATGTINFDVIDQSILYYTSNASANWTVNMRGDSTTTLNNYMATGESITVAFMVTQGSNAYYQTNFQIGGSNVTPKWQGASAPTEGNANGIDVYLINVIKTGANAYTVLESVTQFG